MANVLISSDIDSMYEEVLGNAKPLDTLSFICRMIVALVIEGDGFDV